MVNQVYRSHKKYMLIFSGEILIMFLEETKKIKQIPLTLDIDNGKKKIIIEDYPHLIH